MHIGAASLGAKKNVHLLRTLRPAVWNYASKTAFSLGTKMIISLIFHTHHPILKRQQEAERTARLGSSHSDILFKCRAGFEAGQQPGNRQLFETVFDAFSGGERFLNDCSRD